MNLLSLKLSFGVFLTLGVFAHAAQDAKPSTEAFSALIHAVGQGASGAALAADGKLERGVSASAQGFDGLSQGSGMQPAIPIDEVTSVPSLYPEGQVQGPEGVRPQVPPPPPEDQKPPLPDDPRWKKFLTALLAATTAAAGARWVFETLGYIAVGFLGIAREGIMGIANNAWMGAGTVGWVGATVVFGITFYQAWKKSKVLRDWFKRLLSGGKDSGKK